MSRRLAFALAVAVTPTLGTGRHASRVRGHRVRQPRRADAAQRHHQIGHRCSGRRLHATVRRDGADGQVRGPASLTLPAFCRVEATARPTSDSDIRFEVWIPPAEAWNGKFEGVGNGGYSGAIGYAAMATGLRRGYAVASTDTGHTGDDMKFGQGHPEKIDRLGVPLGPRDDRDVEADRPHRRRDGSPSTRTSSAARPAAIRRSPRRSAIPRTTTASSPAIRPTTASVRRSRSCIRGSRRTTRTASRSFRRPSCRC